MNMKQLFGMIILLFSTICILSCDVDNDKPDFNTTSLKQTQWSGTLNESYIASMDNPVLSTIEVGIFFIDDKKGRYSLKWETIVQPTEDIFEYCINDKILTVENGTKLNGNWLLIQFDGNTMVLEKGTSGNGAYKGVLTLIKQN